MDQALSAQTQILDFLEWQIKNWNCKNNEIKRILMTFYNTEF